eukprot:gene10500-biopygen16792
MKIWRRRRRGFFLDFNTRIRGNLCKSGCSGGKSRGPGPGASGVTAGTTTFCRPEKGMEQDEPHGQHGTGRHGKEPLHPHPSAEWRRRWSVCVGGGMQAVRARVARRTTVTRGGTGPTCSREKLVTHDSLQATRSSICSFEPVQSTAPLQTQHATHPISPAQGACGACAERTHAMLAAHVNQNAAGCLAPQRTLQPFFNGMGGFFAGSAERGRCRPRPIRRPPRVADARNCVGSASVGRPRAGGG